MTPERLTGAELWPDRGIREIEGYWCAVKDKFDLLDVRRTLFGPDSLALNNGRYSAIAMNGLNAFSTIEDAVRVKRELAGRSGSSEVSVVHIRLRIGLSPEDWVDLEKTGGPFVVIWRREDFDIGIIGSAMEGRPHTSSTVPGADVQDTELKPIALYSTAEYIRHEVARQGRGVARGAYIGTFQII